ncbi:MAG: GNAT family N-acetyltransferase [Rhodospirillales bacterium]|nr:GNAT family N-acetyltransferase [Rhodospirillales bacterium]
MPQITIRPALLRQTGPDDAELLKSLVQGLADYENEPDAVKATAEDFRRHGLGDRPRYEALIAELDGKPAGFALFFHNYSTWTGKPGIYLEDFFVYEWARGHGLGNPLNTRLAKVAKERDCGRIDLWVLHWNKTREFYHHMGIRHMDQWVPYRTDRDGIEKLAAEDVG